MTSGPPAGSGRTIVVGAGLSGLAAGFALLRRGREVLVLEASRRPGGVVRTERRDGFLLEAGPNTVRAAPELWSLIEDLGLAGEVVLADPRSPRFVDFGGSLHPVPISPRTLLGSRLLTASGKLRLFAEPLVSPGTDPEESVADFVTRRLGAEAADRLVEPFVAGVFAGSSRNLVLSAAFPALHRLERDHGSLFAGALAQRLRRSPPPRPSRPRGLLSFRGGMETLPRALAGALGPALRCGALVGSVAPRGGRWTVSAAGEDFDANRVVLAVPAGRAAELVSAFEPEAARALDEIAHPPVAVLHLAWPESALRRSLRGFGHLVAPGGGRRILGAVWSSSLFPGRTPPGRCLFTVFLGGARDPRAHELSDAELAATAARDLQAAALVRGDPQPVMVTRWPRAIPQYERGHARRMETLAAAERRLPGLRFLGSYRGGVSVGDVVRNGLAEGDEAPA